MAIINISIDGVKEHVESFFDLMKYGIVSIDDISVSLKRGSYALISHNKNIIVEFSNPLIVNNKEVETELNSIRYIGDKLKDLEKLFTDQITQVSSVEFKVRDSNPIFKMSLKGDYISLVCDNSELDLVYMSYISRNIAEVQIYRDHAKIIKQGLDFKIKFK